MPKYIIYADDGKTPVVEFDAEKENPHLYDMLRRGGDILKELKEINNHLPHNAPSLVQSIFLFVGFLKQLNTSEAALQKAYAKNIRSTVNEMKNFIADPEISVSQGAFSDQFQHQALSQVRLVVDDIEGTYDRILNRCMAMRADLLGGLSIGLAILSVILGAIGAASLFR